jgi:hypothetical protein
MQWSENLRKTGNVTFTACSLDNKPFQLKLEEVRIPFEPSCFQGDGTEKRLTICFSGADESLKKQLADMEASIDATTSCLKDDVVRCKINIDSCRCYDETKKRSELHIPPSMRGWTVNAQVHLRGKWATRQGCGLSLEVTDLQFLQEVREPPCPF